MEKCVQVSKYLAVLCSNHSFEISVWLGVAVFNIVGIRYLWFAIIIWLVISGLDMLFGSIKAKFYKDNWDSRIFGKAFFKRAIVFVMGWLVTIIARHLSTLFADDNIRTIISIVPIGYFHLFSFQEFGSLLEHWVDTDPNNWATRLIKKIYWIVKQRTIDKVDDMVRQYTDRFYDDNSPDNWKLYLHRDIKND